MESALKTRTENRDRLLRLQRKIYLSLKADADRVFGEMPPSIRAYEREYHRDFPKSGKLPARISKPELIEAVRSAEITLIADYHTYPQAQRTALRILRETVLPRENWILGLEMIPSHCQGLLDDFQNGQITEGEFLRLIRYEERWGFPWEHYAPLFRWAIDHGVRLVGLNLPEPLHPEEQDLQHRDRWAAGIITDLFASAASGPSDRGPLRMIALYGELHIGRTHLPRSIDAISRAHLGRKLRQVTIHQNNEDLYWRLARAHLDLESEIVRVRSSDFCVFSGPPWAKLQSLISWAEVSHHSTASARTDGARPLNGGYGEADYGDFCDDDDEEVSRDHLFQMKTFGDAISEFLGLPAMDFSGLTTLTIDEADFPARGLSDLSREELALIRYHVLHNQRIYIPRPQIAYLAIPSENGSAEIAARHLFRVTLEGEEPLFKRSSSGFGLLLLEASFGFLGSLILNPRRKCDLPIEHEARLRALRAGQRAAFPHEIQARELALSLLPQLSPDADGFKSNPLLKEAMKRRGSAPVLAFSARYLGQILGRGVHEALVSGDISRDQVTELYFGKGDSDLSPTPIDRIESIREVLAGIQLAKQKRVRL